MAKGYSWRKSVGEVESDHFPLVQVGATRSTPPLRVSTPAATVPASPSRDDRRVMMLMTPAVPSAGNCADGLVITSTRANCAALILRRIDRASGYGRPLNKI